MNWWRVNKVGEFLRELMDFKREESLSKFDFLCLKPVRKPANMWSL